MGGRVNKNAMVFLDNMIIVSQFFDVYKEQYLFKNKSINLNTNLTDLKL